MLDRISPARSHLVIGVVLALIVVLTVFTFANTIHSLSLLEEIYLLEFLKARTTSFMAFVGAIVDWNGPLPEDSWGMLASAITALFASFHSTQLLRIVSIIFQGLNGILLFFVARDALAPPEEERPAISTWLAATAALIFSTYPLAPEAVSWIGGFAYQLGLAFFLTAFYLYLKGKRERNWTILGIAWISFLFAIVSDNSLWSSGFIMVALELAKSFIGPPSQEKQNQRVATHDEVFEDLVDKMLEDEHRGIKQRHAESERQELTTQSGESDGTTTDTNTKSSGGENQQQQPQQTEKKQPGEPKVYDEDDGPDNLFDTLVPTLPFIVLGVLLSLKALPATGNEQLPGGMIAGLSDWARVFKHLFFPINQSIITEYATQYTQMYVLYTIPLVVSLVALARNRQFRQNVAFLLAWLIVIVVPHLHTAVCNSSLMGSRLAYTALVPTCGLIALVFFAPSYAIAGLPPARKESGKVGGVAISVFLLCLLMLVNVNRTRLQIEEYDKGAENFHRLGSLLRSTSGKQQFAFLKNMPRQGMISTHVSPLNMVAFDSKQMLLHALNIPDGHLKDALKKGELSGRTFHWNTERMALDPITLDLVTAPLKKMNAEEIKNAMKAGPEANKSIHLDEANHELLVESENQAPVLLNIETQGMHALGDDFVYLDCKIDASNSDSDARIEMYWVSAWQKNFDNDRMSSCKIETRLNDKQFHRYYFPVRSNAWTTNGAITQLRFGFPPDSHVSIKEIGTDSPQDRLARLQYVRTSSRATGSENPKQLFSRLTYDYPEMPELGLITLDRNNEEVTLKYDTSMVTGATGSLIEISRADNFFDKPNQDDVSENPLKTMSFKNTSGELRLPDKDFKLDGVYSIRVFATDKDGKLLANASDVINCLIYTRPRGS